MELTEQQNKALSLRDKNILVSASAGSGKTFVMVKRIIELIKEGARLNEMLIITFTKAAASDMREKIGKALVEFAETNPDCASEIRALPSAKIGTIDSWCQNLVKKYFFIADFDADFEIISSSEARVMAETVIDELIDESMESPEFFELYDSFIVNRSDKTFKDFIMKLMEFASTQINPLQWLEGCTAIYDGDFAQKIVSAHIDEERKKILIDLEALQAESARSGYEALKKYCSTLESALYEKRRLPQFRGADNDFPNLNEEKENICKRIKDLQDDIAKVENFQPLSKVKEQAQAAAEFAKKLTEILFKQKKLKAVAEYNDIEQLACKILDNDDARAEILPSCKYVFVDEYQDVNPLQDALISKAVGGTLYIVGDVKQSIYGFRMSEPELFLDKYRHPQNYGDYDVIEFRDNFRSSDCVIDFCNAVFGNVMSEQFGGMDYANAALVAGRGYEGGEVRVRIGLSEKKENAEKAEIQGVYSVKNAQIAQKERETGVASAVYDAIYQLLNFGDKDGNKVKPSDIAVLFRSSTPAVRQLYDMLRKNDVSVFLREKNYFAGANEVCVLQSFLKLIAYGKDETALASVLLSPIGGLDENDLYAISKMNEKSFFENALRYAETVNDERAEKISAVFALVEKYGEYARYMTVGELLSAFIAQTDYVAILLAGDNGAFQAETVVKYIDYLSDLKVASSLSDYIGYIESGNEQFEAEAPDDALKIMTVHVSKGLEFPYVFLIETQKRFNMEDCNRRYIFDRDLGLCMKAYGAEQLLDNAVHEAASIRKIKKTKEEEMRLLYVALTRAENSLYIYSSKECKDISSPEDADCFFDWIKPVSDGKIEYFELKDYQDDNGANGKYFGGHNEKLTEIIKSRIERDIASSGVKIKTTVTGLSAEEGMSMTERLPDEDRFGSDNAIMNKGTAYHAIMEKIDFFASFDDEKKRLSELFTKEIDEKDISFAQSAVRGLLESFGGKAYREQSFVAANSDGTLVQGVIDLLLVNGKNAIILDYKLTGTKNLLKDQYKNQINYYADAAEKILNVNVIGMYLYSFTGREMRQVERNAKLT